jgi:hypothetical protein
VFFQRLKMKCSFQLDSTRKGYDDINQSYIFRAFLFDILFEKQLFYIKLILYRNLNHIVLIYVGFKVTPSRIMSDMLKAKT